MTAPAAQRPRISTAPPAVITDAPDRIWAVNFHFDVTTAGWPIKIGPIVDERTRVGRTNALLPVSTLIAELSRLAIERGTLPAVPQYDKGLGLVCGIHTSASASTAFRSQASRADPVP